MRCSLGETVERWIALRMFRTKGSHDPIDDLTIRVGEFVEFDPHARWYPRTTTRYPNDAADRAQHISTPGQPKVHRDLGPCLMRLLRLDEEATFIDVPGELGEHLINCRIVDSHGHAASAGSASVIVFRGSAVALRIRFQTDSCHDNFSIGPR